MSNQGILICPHCNAMLTITATAAQRQKSFGDKSFGEKDKADISGLADILSSIDEDNLDDGELEFVQRTKARFKKYKDAVLLTEKQMDWLRRLAKKGF